MVTCLSEGQSSPQRGQKAPGCSAGSDGASCLPISVLATSLPAEVAVCLDTDELMSCCSLVSSS